MAKALQYRGFMLDVARHFMPLENIKALAAAAGHCGINRLHLHLTEDQGWRLEIRRYPKLTEVGSKRGYSTFGGVSPWKNNNGFYTQQEIRELVAFCREHGVEIIPEVDLPGHASALLAAYPEVGCQRRIYRRQDSQVLESGYSYQVETGAGIYQNLVCAGRESTLDFLRNVFDEIMELFPFPMIHLGGDEALKLHWRRCPLCQQRMKAEGLESEDALQRWLTLEIGRYLHEHGREVIVWNDVLAGGMLPDYFIVQQWLGQEERTRKFMAQGGRVIQSDNRLFYLNRPYGSIDLHSIWSAPQIPDYAVGEEEGLLGVECPVWSERITDGRRAEYLLFPRLIGHALKAGGETDLDWDTFLARVAKLEDEVEADGIEGAPRAQWHMMPEDARREVAESRKFVDTEEFQQVIRRENRCTRTDRAERLMQAIGMPEAFMIRVGDSMFCESQAAYEEDDGAAELGRHLKEALINREEGAWKNLPETVWLDTMKCFTRFVKEHGVSYGWYGFDRGFWTVRQVQARLFRLGELEYELLETEGRRVISIHIPSDARLEADKLNASVEKAHQFLHEYFSGWADAAFECESWLLSPKLRTILRENARIVHFQNAFDLEHVDRNDRGAVEWVFQLSGRQAANADIASLPENTMLQRGVKNLLMQGSAPGSARGRLARKFE